MCSILLGFYDGASWSEVASTFLGGLLDLPTLAWLLAVSLSWPTLPEFKLTFQLALGLMVVAINLVMIAGKWALRNGQSSLRMRSRQAGRAERWAVRGLGWFSWRPFSAAMDVSKGALGASGGEVVGRWQDVWKPIMKLKHGTWGQPTDEPLHGSSAQRVRRAAVPTLRMLTLVDPAISAWKQPRVKAFGKEAGDDVVEDWCEDETSMGSRTVVVAEGNARVTYVTLAALCTKSIWLVQLEISGCYGIKGDVAPLGLLFALRVLRARGCGGLTGTCCVEECEGCRGAGAECGRMWIGVLGTSEGWLYHIANVGT